MLGETTGDSSRYAEPETAVSRAATALSGVIRTTLGPNGMDKMVIGEKGTVIITNDGSSIINWMDIDHPVGRLLKDVAVAQDDSVGDGATTAVVLAGALLSEAAALRADGLHPTTIVDGYVQAFKTAVDQLEHHELEIDTQYDDRLNDLARTAITGRWDADATERFAHLTLDALRAVDFDTSKLTLKSYAGGELRESMSVDGLVVDLQSSSTSVEVAGHAQFGDIDNPLIAMVDGKIGISEPDQIRSVQFENT
ncbi:MAG: chaperonin GroEL (HSP60 family), partial [Haloquadratum sp. J07HQX50]